jgi:hypothetical protein
MLLLNSVCPVSVDTEALSVGDNQQGRIFQRHRIKLKLLVGTIEVRPVLLVFPAEVTALPHVREAASAIKLRDAFLESIALRVGGFVGRWLAEHAAQINEMFLCGLAFCAVQTAPFLDEFFGRHS